MKELYFIRHGESEMNVAGVQSGHTDTALTDKGKQQAQQAGQNAKSVDLKPNRVFSSPLQRAHHTAIGVVEHLDFDKDSIELLETLKERNFGILEGKNMTEDYGISLDVYIEDETSLDHIEGVEKLKEMHDRALDTIDYMKQQPEDVILIVAHGAFGRALYRAANHMSFNDKVPFIENAQIMRLI